MANDIIKGLKNSVTGKLYDIGLSDSDRAVLDGIDEDIYTTTHIKSDNFNSVSFELGTINTNTGAMQTSTDTYRSSDFIPVVGGKTIYAIPKSPTKNKYVFVFQYNSIKQVINLPATNLYLTGMAGWQTSITLDVSCAYIKITEGISDSYPLQPIAIYYSDCGKTEYEDYYDKDIKELKLETAGKADEVKAVVDKYAGYATKFMDKNMNTDGIYDAAVDGNVIYTCGIGNKINIYDTSVETAPTLESTITIPQGSEWNITGLAIKENYLYISCRLRQPNVPSGDYPAFGALYVYNTTTKELVFSDVLMYKCSRVVIHDNLLALNMQMSGWRLYDISTPSTPVLKTEWLFADHSADQQEHQGGAFMENGSNLYYVASGFGNVIAYVYDVTDAENVSELTKILFQSIGLAGKAHSFDVKCDYPYIYSTVAPEGDNIESQDPNDDKLRHMGLAVSDVSDLSNIATIFYAIPNGMKNVFDYSQGDSKPTRVALTDYHIILNNGNKGLALFDRDTNNFIANVPCSAKSSVYALTYSEDGRIVCADGPATNFTNRNVRIYRGI